MNEPTKSKINWTALFTQIMTIALIAGWIPEAYSTPALAIVGIVSPALVQVFRTWYTAPTDEFSEYRRLKRKYEE